MSQVLCEAEPLAHSERSGTALVEAKKEQTPHPSLDLLVLPNGFPQSPCEELESSGRKTSHLLGKIKWEIKRLNILTLESWEPFISAQAGGGGSSGLQLQREFGGGLGYLRSYLKT